MLNKVILIGNVGKPPEIRNFQDGNKVANFSLATTRSWKNKEGEWVNKTEWHNVSVFGNTVNFVEKYVKKGSKLYIEGSSETKKWTGQDGQERYATEVVLRPYHGELLMIDKIEKTERVAGKAPIDLDQDIPF